MELRNFFAEKIPQRQIFSAPKFHSSKIFENIFLRRRISRGFRICPRISRARSVAQAMTYFILSWVKLLKFLCSKLNNLSVKFYSRCSDTCILYGRYT